MTRTSRREFLKTAAAAAEVLEGSSEDTLSNSRQLRMVFRNFRSDRHYD
jgi:hypothetical protein